MGKPKDESESKEDIWQDPRFSHLVNDPRFKQLPKSERKVKIDKRFQSMFDGEKFNVKYTTDKYGRRLNKSSSEDLKKYYELNSSDEDDDDEEIRKEEKQITKDVDSESEDDKDQNDELGTDGEILPTEVIKKLKNSEVDYARGEGRILTDSSSDDESSDDEDDEVFIEHVWGELDNDAPTTEESTRRLAACNMDWDRIRACDIMILCNSFLPTGGSIESITIYPSEYGKERMAEEEINGPPELTAKDDETTDDSDSDDGLAKEQDSDAEEGDDYHMEKLRQYQLNRLKYYYAVIECDSVATADKLYKECDGLEYESTATKLDLRFIPDDLSFDENEPKDKCTELPDLSKYQPRLFTTTALQQARVELTWDETNVDRKEISDKLSSGKIKEVSDLELRSFLAHSSEDDESSNEETNKDNEIDDSDDENETKVKNQKIDAISKYKSLLEEINKKEEETKKNKFEMEYTWGINVNDKSKVKFETKAKQQLTPIEKALEKKKEKNKKRKEERKKKAKGRNDDAAQSDYSSEDDVPDGIDLNDPYFAEEFNNEEFGSSKSTKKSKKIEISNESDEEEQKSKELELLLNDDDDNKNHFSLKKIQDAENETKSKKRRKKLKKSKQEIEAEKAKFDDGFEVNIKDDRFKALYTSHEFNIDPTDSHFKKTKGMETIIQEKLKRRHTGNSIKNTEVDEENALNPLKRTRKNIENSMLIKNLKRKINVKQNKS